MILKGPKNVKGEKASNSHGGIGGYFVRTLLTSEFDSSLKYVREFVLDPGASIGNHLHDGDEEVYYVIAGEGIMFVNDEEEVITTGDIVLTKSGSYHGLKNTGPDILKIFVACANISTK